MRVKRTEEWNRLGMFFEEVLASKELEANTPSPSSSPNHGGSPASSLLPNSSP